MVGFAPGELSCIARHLPTRSLMNRAFWLRTASNAFAADSERVHMRTREPTSDSPTGVVRDSGNLGAASHVVPSRFLAQDAEVGLRACSIAPNRTLGG